MKVDDRFANAMLFQKLERIIDERSSVDEKESLGSAVGQRPKTRPEPCRKDHRFHDRNSGTYFLRRRNNSLWFGCLSNASRTYCKELGMCFKKEGLPLT